MTKHLASLSRRGWETTQCGGFTLLELMITIALVAIVMGIGVPSYQDFVVKNRIQTQASEIRSSLAMARVEAIRRGLWVVVCPGQTACQGEWEEGWNSFVDTNTNGVFDADDIRLEIHARLDGGGTLTMAAGDVFVFRSDGTAVAARTLNLCTAEGVASPHRRRISVSSVGRIRVCGPAAAGEPACPIVCG